jgi:DtxR family Mn-dependent transcriptional regulator
VLGNPTVDPHGSPIPSRDGKINRTACRQLSSVSAGETVTVVEVDDRDPDLLRYLGKLALYPGTELDVLAVEPFQGPLVLRSGEREFILGREAATKIRVTDVT